MVFFSFSIKTVHTALRFFRRLRCPLPLLFAAQCTSPPEFCGSLEVRSHYCNTQTQGGGVPLFLPKRWQIFPTGCSMIFDCPVVRRPLMVRAALLRRGCDGVAAATEMRRSAPSRSFCASRLSIHTILVGLSITAVDTYVVQYGVWVYATHAFRQSADSSGISS